MASPFSFVRNVFGRGDNKDGQAATRALGGVPDSIEAIEPASIKLVNAKQQFYCALFDLPESNGFDLSGQKLSVPQKLVVDVLKNSLSEKDYRTHAVPRLPSIIPKLLRSLRDPDTSPRDYVRIINKDPAIMAGVLKLANSVYFNPTSNRINSIDIAVVKLGIEGLRSVLSAAVMQPLVQRKSNYFSQFGKKLWEHTLACAVVCEQVALKRGMEPYKAYLLGLTHEVGRITIFSELCKEFQKSANREKPSVEAFIPFMQERSESLSATIALDWDLPKEIISALQQQIELQSGSRVGPFGYLLFQANLASEAYLINKFNPNAKIDLDALARELSFPENIFRDLDHLAVEL